MAFMYIRRKSRNILKPLLLAFAIIFFLSCFTLYGSYRFDAAQAAETIARVDGVDIPRSEYEREYSRLSQQLQSYGGHNLSTQWYAARAAFHNLIDDYAKQKAAERMGVSVSAGDVQAEIDAAVEDQLKRLGEGLTQDQKEEARNQLAQQLSLQRDAKRRELLTNRLEEKLKAKARPVELEVAQILIKTDKRSDEQALKQARAIYEKASIPGADFAALAKKSSEDEATKNKGGDIGWLILSGAQATTRPAPLVASAYMLKKGEVSEPVPTDAGYVILKASGERAYVPPPSSTPPRTPPTPPADKKAEGGNKPADKAADAAKKAEEERKKAEDERKQQIEQYREQVASRITQGYFEVVSKQSQVKGLTPFAKGLLEEKQLAPQGRLSETSPEGKAKLQQAVRFFEEARSTTGAEIGPAYEFHLGELYQKLGQSDKARQGFENVLRKVDSAEVRMALGETLQKSGDKKGAIDAYRQAYEKVYNEGFRYRPLAEKFRELGRKDLAAKAEKDASKFEEEQQAQQQMGGLGGQNIPPDVRARIMRQIRASQRRGGARGGASNPLAARTRGSTGSAPLKLNIGGKGNRTVPTPLPAPPPGKPGGR